jgi:hypothetical protein
VPYLSLLYSTRLLQDKCSARYRTNAARGLLTLLAETNEDPNSQTR